MMSAAVGVGTGVGIGVGCALATKSESSIRITSGINAGADLSVVVVVAAVSVVASYVAPSSSADALSHNGVAGSLVFAAGRFLTSPFAGFDAHRPSRAFAERISSLAASISAASAT